MWHPRQSTLAVLLNTVIYVVELFANLFIYYNQYIIYVFLNAIHIIHKSPKTDMK